MKLFLTIFAVFALVLGGAQHLHAYLGQDTTSNYCSPTYTDVEKIYLSYEANLPEQSSVDWSKVLEGTKKLYTEVLSTENLTLEITDKSPEELLSAEPGALYVKAFFSHADKNAFSIPLSDNFLATWLEISRLLDGKSEKPVKIEKGTLLKQTNANAKDYIITTKTAPDFLTFDTTDPLLRITLSSAPTELMNNLICNVMYFTAHKQCSNRQQFSENEFSPVTEKCVPYKDDQSSNNVSKIVLHNSASVKSFKTKYPFVTEPHDGVWVTDAITNPEGNAFHILREESKFACGNHGCGTSFYHVNDDHSFSKMPKTVTANTPIYKKVCKNELSLIFSPGGGMDSQYGEWAYEEQAFIHHKNYPSLERAKQCKTEGNKK